MPAIEQKVPGTFAKVPGGYARQIGPNAQLFIPDMCAASFDEDAGEVHEYAPDYTAIEAARTPAVHADKPGEYAYYYETQHAPTGCDYSAELCHDGRHYFLRPLRDGLPPLHGRGIKYDERSYVYYLTAAAYDKLKAQYKISFEMFFD